MHKRLVNHCTIDLSIIPDGPILIKSGKQGADPTKPDMEFVETYHAGKPTIYLPGSSLKGAIRAHAERIVKTVGSEQRPLGDTQKLWASNPLKNDEYLDNVKEQNKNNPNIGEILYKGSSFTDQMFGNTSIASRIRIEDAYPDESKIVRTEERNGVAIDRVFGSTIPGALFNYQVCTGGEFHTKIHLKNFTLSQLGLIGLVLRDLNDGWFGLGFAKSRGLGTVRVQYNKAVVQYPGCQIDSETRKINQLGNSGQWNWTFLLGVGEFLLPEEARKYGFPQPDYQDSPVRAESMELDFGVQLKWEGDTESGVKDLFMRSVRAWSKVLAA
ncbi:RAMP superfamily CRISPR-associated protein [Nostoc sp. WHI]|uniref:RAMP superfamily CRISPR-associated protein n=1 Tax=Nostoc sp. WHI TaxID=2650611 RepID=UPI0018C47521|nr:RAMP superfamily CRISPR-associated protein [Nostoc sp. WHI]MBG1271220.1 CRISPR-associated protein [Nostoc sp. WHI]